MVSLQGRACAHAPYTMRKATHQAGTGTERCRQRTRKALRPHGQGRSIKQQPIYHSTTTSQCCTKFNQSYMPAAL